MQRRQKTCYLCKVNQEVYKVCVDLRQAEAGLRSSVSPLHDCKHNEGPPQQLEARGGGGGGGGGGSQVDFYTNDQVCLYGICFPLF